MVCLIRDDVRVGEFSSFYASVEALESFGFVGDFVVGNFEIATKTAQGIVFKPKFRAKDKQVEALKKTGKLVLSSLI